MKSFYEGLHDKKDFDGLKIFLKILGLQGKQHSVV